MNIFRACVLITIVFNYSFLYGQIFEKRTDSDESYAVYSVVLKDFDRNPQTNASSSLLVINAETEIYDNNTPIDTALKNMGVSLTAKYKQALEDYKTKNSASEKLTKSFKIEQDYIFIDSRVFQDFFTAKKSGNEWDSFYAEYPNSSGFITLSRVGFDAEKRNAFVYVEVQCGFLCGRGNYILVAKKGKIWSVSKAFLVWAS